MDTSNLRQLRRELEAAGVRFVRENEPGSGARVGGILARSSDDIWIAIGDGPVNSDASEKLREILDAIATGQI